jgi:NAD(P)-dependent dehydrogenase (short-subunit alcohol dehydrogenase family)
VTDSGRNVQFVKCDTTSWKDQLHMFKQAVAKSPDKSCDIVIANAGVSGPDELYALEGLMSSMTVIE